MLHRKILWILVVLAVVASAVLVSACGSKESTDTTSGEGTTAAVDLTEAQALVDQYKATPAWNGPTESYDVTSLQGKTVVFIAADYGIPFNKTMADAFSDAAEALGFTAVTIDGKSTPDNFTRGVQQAISLNASAICLLSISPELVQNQIDEARAKGIKIISSANYDAGVEVPETIDSNVTVNYTRVGELQAAYALVKSGGEVNAVGFGVPQFPADAAQMAGQKALLERLAPGSKYRSEDLLLSNFQTQLPTKVQTFITSDPEINWFLPTFDALMLYIQPGVHQADAAGRIWGSSHNALDANLEWAQAEDVQAMTVGENLPLWTWAIVDEMGRLILDLPKIEQEIPLRIFDKEVIDASGWPEAGYDALYGNLDFREKYKALWLNSPTD